MLQIPYVEQDCTFTHQGRKLTAGGALVTEDRIVAYIGDDKALVDWHGNRIGTFVVVATWPIFSWVSRRMCQIEATVNGVTYTGRSHGKGMIYRGRRKARQ